MAPSRNLPSSSGAAPRAAGPERPDRSAPALARPLAALTRWPGALPLGRGTAGGAIALALLLLAVAIAGTGYRYEPYADEPLRLADPAPDGRGLQQLSTRLRGRQRELSARLAAAAPRGVYIVIDQTQNRLYLRRGDDTLLEAVCSTGSGMVLRESGGKKREWIFDSPRGRFEVRSMSRNPVWSKPDWAFVEESQPIPRNAAERLDYGSLGEYALNFGNGFLIHGTLYERLLGRAVSHGCIRVGRDDLRKVWASARIGMQIYIY